MIIIQNADADKAERYNEPPFKEWSLDDEEWRTIATAETYKEAMQRFIFELNDEAVNIENGWIRIYNTETEEFLTELY